MADSNQAAGGPLKGRQLPPILGPNGGVLVEVIADAGGGGGGGGGSVTQGTSPWVVSGPLTDAQLRASAVPVSASFTDPDKITDNTAFVDGTSKLTPTAFILDETAGTALTENDAAAARIDSKRSQVITLEDATTRGQRAAVSAANALKVDGSAVTQPVSGTVSIAANQSVNVAQVAGTTTDTNSGSKSAGTQRVVLATDQPQLTNALKVDGSGVTQPISGNVTNAGTFAVQDSQVITDNAGFTDGTSKVLAAGYILDETAGTALTENDAAAARIDSKRAQIGVLEDATTRGQRATVSAGGALKVDGSAATQPVSGTVTANAGTNLNTSALALDATLTGGTQKSKLVDTGGTNVASVSAAGRLSVDASGVAVPVTDNSGSLTIDAPVGTPVFVELSDGAAVLKGQKTMANSVPVTIASDQTGGSAITYSAQAATAITATSATGNGALITLATTNYNTVVLSERCDAGTQTTAESVAFEVSDDGGTNYFSVYGVRVTVGDYEQTHNTAVSETRLWQFNVAGFTNWRVRQTVAVIGTANITWRAQTSAAITQPRVVVDAVMTSPAGVRLSDGTVALLAQKTMAGSLPVTIASDQSAVPASQSGTWTVQPGNTANTTAWKVDGSAVTQPVSGTVTANPALGQGKTLLFASVSVASSGDNSIVTADASNKIKLVSYVLVADAAVNVKWRNGTTDITGPMAFAANSGAAIAGQPSSHLMETAVNAALQLNLSAAVGVRGHISYFKEP